MKIIVMDNMKCDNLILLDSVDCSAVIQCNIMIIDPISDSTIDISGSEINTCMLYIGEDGILPDSNFSSNLIIRDEYYYSGSVDTTGISSIDIDSTSPCIFDSITISSPLTNINGSLYTNEFYSDGSVEENNVLSGVSGENWNLIIPSGTINTTYSTISDSHASGGALFTAFIINGNIDGGNNTGWIFDGNGGFQEIAKAFDNDLSTYAQNWNMVPCWMGYDLGAGNKKPINKYSIITNNFELNYSPTAWIFQGTNDIISDVNNVADIMNATWISLDTQLGITWSFLNEQKDFIISNENFYRYYRWFFTSPNIIAIAELRGYSPLIMKEINCDGGWVDFDDCGVFDAPAFNEAIHIMISST